jgi:excisionase family DNA binding protein
MHSVQDTQERRGGPDLFSAGQVEALLGVDKSTVYRMASDGRLPAIKVGRQWRFPAGPIRDLLDGAGIVPSFDGGPQGGAGGIPGSSSDLVQPIVDLAASLLGVMMVATDMEGRPLTDVANPCPWFAARADDPATLTHCVEDWRVLANEIDLEPRLAVGSHGFECARAFIRDGNRLVGMVLAGGIVPQGADRDDRVDLYNLDDAARQALLSALPRVATTISRVVSRPTSPTRSTP